MDRDQITGAVHTHPLRLSPVEAFQHFLPAGRDRLQQLSIIRKPIPRAIDKSVEQGIEFSLSRDLCVCVESTSDTAKLWLQAAQVD